MAWFLQSAMDVPVRVGGSIRRGAVHGIGRAISTCYATGAGSLLT